MLTLACVIYTLVEQDRVQGSTAHQILKKHKKWEKKYRFEPTEALRVVTTEDPFLQKQNPHLDQVIREFVRTNPPRTRPPGYAGADLRRGHDRNGRVSTMRDFKGSPNGKLPMARTPLETLSEKKKAVVKKLFN